MEKNLRVLGIDMAQQIFHVVGMDETGKIALRKRILRGALMSFIAQMPPVVTGEVSGSEPSYNGEAPTEPWSRSRTKTHGLPGCCWPLITSILQSTRRPSQDRPNI